jgi:hypothetical protein
LKRGEKKCDLKRGKEERGQVLQEEGEAGVKDFTTALFYYGF